MFYLSTEGAPLLFVLDDNELIGLNPDDFYLTDGPVTVHSINHTSNQDDYANLVDPLHIVIKNHHFGPDYDNVAIEVTRSDVEGVPSSTIEIINSLFEHSSTDQEMCRFYNIQPADTIVIRGSNFSHGFCSFYFGHQLESGNSTVDTNGSVLIEDCRFGDNSASPSLGVYDLDANMSGVSNSDDIVIHRNSMTINDSVFVDNVGPHAVVEVVMAHRNELEDGDATSFRVDFDGNEFRDNSVVQVIKFTADYDDAAAADYEYLSGPNVRVHGNTFTDNNVSFVVYENTQ
ncbi:MAG: hypothetical protein GY826_37780, partial [Fuerstiella sp.]|nr:hypothetical protein [Fuerstiella sp.]